MIAELTLDLDKSLPPAGPVTVRARDVGAAMSAEVLDRGDPLDMTGMTVTFHAIDREGGTSTAPAEVSADGLTATWAMPAVATPGRALAAYLWLVDGEAELSTQEIRLDVAEGVADEPDRARP